MFVAQLLLGCIITIIGLTIIPFLTIAILCFIAEWPLLGIIFIILSIIRGLARLDKL